MIVDRYYYAQLNKQEQAVYKAFYNGLMAHEEKPENTGNMRKIKILFVCHGNICRSPMAESIFNYMIKEKGIADKFETDSAGTSREEIGHEVHRGTVRKLKEMNIPVTPHKARQMTWVDYEYFDYIIAMDSMNVAGIIRIAGDSDYDGKVHKIMEYAGEDRDVADPWYTGNFDATYDDISRSVEGLLNTLNKKYNLF